MFDWFEYDERTRRENAEQEKRLGLFLNRYFEKYKEIRQMPIFDEPSQETLDRIAAMEIPEQGRDPMVVGEELISDVFEQAMLIQHPRFFSFVASSVSPYSLAGAILTDIYNLHGGGFEHAPGAAVIEEKLVDWMAGCAGYPEETRGGLFMSGASMGNLTAMVAARDSKLDPYEFGIGTVYMSDQTHISNAKGLRIIGFRSDQIVIIPTDENFKMRTDLLEEAIKKDISEGKKPFAVIGSIGTTNTGTIDPLDKIGEVAQKYNLWFHVDGAYGGSVLLSPIYRNAARGIEMTDSMSWDTHKWLMQTYSCSTLLVRDKTLLLNSFAEHPEYLEDVISADHYNDWDLGPEMSKPVRAIKLWYTVQSTGTEMLGEMIEYSFHLARLVQTEIKKLPNWKIISEPSCGTINIRYEVPGLSDEELDKLTVNISKAVNQTGYAYIVTTTLLGRKTLRMCMINANTTEEDVCSTIKLLNEIAIKEAEKLNAEKLK